MAFGPIKTGARRGRPPKEPRQWPADEPPARRQRVDDVAALDPQLASQTVEDLEAELRELRARYERDVDDRVQQVRFEKR